MQKVFTSIKGMMACSGHSVAGFSYPADCSSSLLSTDAAQRKLSHESAGRRVEETRQGAGNDGEEKGNLNMKELYVASLSCVEILIKSYFKRGHNDQ